MKTKCPRCKDRDLIADEDFSEVVTYWYCEKCRGLWHDSYISGFWIGYHEASVKKHFDIAKLICPTPEAKKILKNFGINMDPVFSEHCKCETYNPDFYQKSCTVCGKPFQVRPRSNKGDPTK